MCMSLSLLICKMGTVTAQLLRGLIHSCTKYLSACYVSGTVTGTGDVTGRKRQPLALKVIAISEGIYLRIACTF